MDNQNAVYIGTYGYVVKIDQTTGKEIWRTSLPNVGYNPTTTYVEDNAVYCGCNGKVFILCCESGKIMAQNEMYGLGFGFVTFTSKKSDKRKNNEPHNQKPNNQKPQINQNNNNPVSIQQMNQQPLFHLPLQQPQMMQPFFIQPFPQQSNFQQASPQFLLQPPQVPLISSQMLLEQNMLNDPFRIQPQQSFPIFHQQPQNNQFQQAQPNFILNPLNQLNYPNQANLQNNSFDSNEMIVVDNSNNNTPLLSQQDILNQFSLTESIKQKQIEEDEKLALSLHQQMNGQQQGRVQQLPKQQQPPKQPQPSKQPYIQNNKNVINLDDLIFVGLNTSIVAINKFSGEDVWRSYIGQYSAPISMTYSDDKLLIGVSGTLQCLDALTGEKCWENNLPGLRYHCVSVVTSN